MIFCGTVLLSQSDGGGVDSCRPRSKLSNSLDTTGSADEHVSSSDSVSSSDINSARAIFEEGSDEKEQVFFP